MRENILLWRTDGGGGGWWMVDGGGWSKKKFFNFAETWHTGSSRYINVHNFRVLVKQLSYGNKIQFQFWKLGKILKRISTKKKKGSLILLKLGTHKVHDKWMCGVFEFWWNNFLMGIKFDFKFEIWENFYKGFPCKTNFPRKFFVKWTLIKIKGNSFVKFSVGGARSIYKEIPL